MKTTKKLVAAIAAFVMALAFASCNEKKGAAGAGASAGTTANTANLKPSPEADFEIKLSDDGTFVSITSYKGKGGKVVVPATIQGLPVKVVKNMNYGGSAEKVTSLAFSEGIEAIGDECCNGYFCNCKEIILPSTLKYIGHSAFFINDVMKLISIPAGVKYMGYGAFNFCDNLETINIPEGFSVFCVGSNELYKYDTDFSSIFDGTKIKESVALQQQLKSNKIPAATKADQDEFRAFRESLGL